MLCEINLQKSPLDVNKKNKKIRIKALFYMKKSK